jgi:peptidoglycan/LPS O-acetylase OafA/YrhL
VTEAGTQASNLASPAGAAERIAELDGVRGLAVLMVLAYHGFAYEMARASWTGLARVVVALTNFGWLGVDLFFVLSGFLITGILLRTKRRPRALRNFYGRRALRILPLYYLVLLVVLLSYDDAGAFVGLSALFLANLTPLFGVAMRYGPLWSLAVEEHFYLVWPWLVRATGRRGLALLAGAIVLGEPLLRWWGFVRGWDINYYSWFRFDGLAWGALLAVLFQRGADDRALLGKAGLLAWGGGAVLLAAGAPAGLLTRQTTVGAALVFTIAQLFFTGLLALTLALRGARWASCWRWGWLRRCGDWSYCLYLIHLLLLQAWDGLAQRCGWPIEAVFGRFGRYGLRALVAFPVAFALAALSYRYFEAPLLQWKRRFS